MRNQLIWTDGSELTYTEQAIIDDAMRDLIKLMTKLKGPSSRRYIKAARRILKGVS